MSLPESSPASSNHNDSFRERHSGSASASATNGTAATADSEVHAQPTVVIQAAPSLPSEMSLEDWRRRFQVWFAVVRRKWLLGAIAALPVGAVVAFILLQRPVNFIAQTTLFAQSTLDKILGTDAVAQMGADGEGVLKNYLSLMKSRTFRQRLAASFPPEMAAQIQAPYLEKDERPTMENLSGLLGGLVEAERERGREFFTISVYHRDPELALAIARQFLTEFHGLVQEQVRGARGDATKVLREQADALSDEIRRLSDERREYRKKFNLITVEENQGIIAERLRRINTAISDIRVERVGLETQLSQAEADLQKTRTPFDNPNLSTYGNIQELRVELDRLRNERAGLATQLGPNHPKMKEADRNFEMIEQTIANSFRLALEDMRAKLAVATATEHQLSDELTAAFSESLELDRLSGGFKRLSDELTAKEQSLATLLQQIERTDREAQRPVEVIRVVDAPYITGATVLQRIFLFAGVGFISLLTFVVVPLGHHFWTERLSGSLDFESEFKREVLGVLPRFSDVKKIDRPHIVRDNVKLNYVESFLALTAQCDLSSKIRYPKSIVVTSTVPGEGKSVTTSNLAATQTRYGRKTVLVDCDFRRPMQHLIHQVEHDEGLLAWAARGFPMTDDLLEPGGPLGLTLLPDGTSLIPAGGIDLQPGHVLVARQMGELLRLLTREFAVVLVDTPPAGVFQDALILARYCAETIVIVREGRAHASQLKKMLGDLEKIQAPALGLILNGSSLKHVHPSIGSRYGYGKYGYGKHGYGKYGYNSSYRTNSKNSGPPTYRSPAAASSDAKRK